MTEQPEKKKPLRKAGERFTYTHADGGSGDAIATEVPGLIITPHDGRGKITATLTHENTGLAIGTDYESLQDADRAASAMAKAGMDWTVKNKGQLEEQRAKLPADVKAAMEVLAKPATGGTKYRLEQGIAAMDKAVAARFVADRRSKRNLAKLCKLGCQEAELRDLLFTVVSLEFSGRGQDKIIPGVTARELKKLSRDLGKLAQRIEDANKAFLPPLEVLSQGSAQHRALGAFTFTPTCPIESYRSLPTVICALAKDFQYMFAHDIRPLIGEAGKDSGPVAGLAREILRNCDQKDDLALLRLLSYVEIRTGHPNCPALAYLLHWAFEVVRTQLGSSLVMPARFGSPEALRKFYDKAPERLKVWVAIQL